MRPGGARRRSRTRASLLQPSTGLPPSAFAAAGTRLYPGDLLAGPTAGCVEGIAHGSAVEIEVEGIGTLEQRVAG